jgi:hypothetical protein
MSDLYLITCTRRKSDARCPAKDLYVSPLFQQSRRFVEYFRHNWFILSAKHGLIRPDAITEPYDVALESLQNEERLAWRESVVGSLRSMLSAGDRVVLLGDDAYATLLAEGLQEHDVTYVFPFFERPQLWRESWLETLMSRNQRLTDLDTFYELLSNLAHQVGGAPLLGDCTGRMNWPTRGVYFFFDDNQPRFEHLTTPRAVRVGTHAVSQGAQSDLWTRVRTHRGASGYSGNHRGSIWRLHVGASMLKAGMLKKPVRTWGQGQSSSEEIRRKEAVLERAVSKYLYKMRLLWLDISDPPSAHSDRAYIEQNSIAILSGALGPIDVATSDWLGNHCPSPAVRRSALWNVNYVDQTYDRKFLVVFERYVAITLGKTPSTGESLAPAGWWRSEDSNQMNLFDT